MNRNNAIRRIGEQRDFGPYIWALKFNFRTVWSFWGENLAMSIFSMRGIRWFQRELLKRLFIQALRVFSFGGLGVAFGLFWDPKNFPLDDSVLGGLPSESARGGRRGTGGIRFRNWNRRNQN